MYSVKYRKTLIVLVLIIFGGAAVSLSGVGHWLARFTPVTSNHSLSSESEEINTRETVAEAARKRMESLDRDFVFKGRVVYESGEPVPSAKVAFTLNSTLTVDGDDTVYIRKVEFTQITDEDGYFVINSIGHAIHITQINGPGLWLNDRGVGTRDLRRPNNRNYGLAQIQETSHYQPDDKRPAIFVLVRSNKVIKAWPSRGGTDVWLSGTKYINSPVIPLKPSVPLTYTDAGWVYRPDQ